MKFSVGQKVKCVNNVGGYEHTLVRGETYEVVSLTSQGAYTYVKRLDGKPFPGGHIKMGGFTERFEAVVEPKSTFPEFLYADSACAGAANLDDFDDGEEVGVYRLVRVAKVKSTKSLA